jgi:hypothetical protein
MPKVWRKVRSAELILIKGSGFPASAHRTAFCFRSKPVEHEASTLDATFVGMSGRHVGIMDLTVSAMIFTATSALAVANWFRQRREKDSKQRLVWSSSQSAK